MKSFLNYLAVFSFVLTITSAMAQGPPINTDRYESALEEYAALKQVNKSTLTKAEKRAWKRDKKILKKVIRAEEAKIQLAQEMGRSIRYQPYPVYGYGPGMYYGSRFGTPYYPRPRRVIVVQPSQKKKQPAPTPRVQRPRRPVQAAPQPQRPRQPVRPRGR